MGCPRPGRDGRGEDRVRPPGGQDGAAGVRCVRPAAARVARPLRLTAPVQWSRSSPPRGLLGLRRLLDRPQTSRAVRRPGSSGSPPGRRSVRTLHASGSYAWTQPRASTCFSVRPMCGSVCTRRVGAERSSPTHGRSRQSSRRPRDVTAGGGRASTFQWAVPKRASRRRSEGAGREAGMSGGSLARSSHPVAQTIVGAGEALGASTDPVGDAVGHPLMRWKRPRLIGPRSRTG